MSYRNDQDYDDLEWSDSLDEIFEKYASGSEDSDDAIPRRWKKQSAPRSGNLYGQSGFLDPNPEKAAFDVGLAYYTVITKLCNVRSCFLTCIDACSLPSDSFRAAKQLFFDNRGAMQVDAVAALEGLGQLYSHLESFLAWLASTYGEESLPRFNPSPANVLLDAWADVSELVESLTKKVERIGSELELDDSETADDDTKAVDTSSSDSFDLYAELYRRFAELYGSKRTSSNDDSDISPIFRRESFEDWLKRMIEGLEDLLQALIPINHQ